MRELKNAALTQVYNSNKEGLKMMNHFEDEDTVLRVCSSCGLNDLLDIKKMKLLSLLVLIGLVSCKNFMLLAYVSTRMLFAHLGVQLLYSPNL